MHRLVFFVLFVLLAVPSTVLARAPSGESSSADHAADVEAVRAAVLDYVEGFYEVAPERIARSVHRNLSKIGWQRDDSGIYREHPRTFEQLMEGARNYNKSGWVPADAPKEITIFEVLDKTASVKLAAKWGIDYMHLAKLDGKWMIIKVVWQSHPPK